MISPAVIKQQALKWWKPFLQREVTGEEFFPKQIERIGRVNPGQVTTRFQELQAEIESLYRESKNLKGIGYVVKSARQNFRRTGTHELPESIVFETAEDFVHVIEKKREWKNFLANYAIVRGSLPQLSEWVLANVELLASSERKWEDILKVCTYFLENPRPDLYIRQLPVSVHTKFIEENDFVLRSLLDYLIPTHIKDPTAGSFSKRYYLKMDEPLIRIRLLDTSYSVNGITDLSLRLSDFTYYDFKCQNVLITENKMNFLALLELSETMAIWSGGGFNISYLKGIEWLSSCRIFYWGDLDIQGFQILHQMRGYFSQTQSLMMDMKTFERFKFGVTEGRSGNVLNLDLLTAEEKEMFDFLRKGNLRLEQEKIHQSYVDDLIRKLLL